VLSSLSALRFSLFPRLSTTFSSLP
jgi:hypothetical protein